MLAIVAACMRGNDRLKICVHNRELWAQILCRNSIMDDAGQAVQTALGRRLRLMRKQQYRNTSKASTTASGATLASAIFRPHCSLKNSANSQGRLETRVSAIDSASHLRLGRTSRLTCFTF